MRIKLKKEAFLKFDKFLKEKKRADVDELFVETYEQLLLSMRREERERVRQMREKAYEKNRPPAPGWWGLKTADFSKEVYRNRVSLKPNDENKELLRTLQDPYLY